MHDQLTEDTTTALALLRELIATYIDHADELRIDARDFRDEVQFEIVCASDDMRRMVGGNKGSHIAALEHLCKAFGRARQVVHKLRLLEPDPGTRREDYPSPIAERFDPATIAKLIESVVMAVGVDQTQIVTVAQNAPNERPLSYLFQIYTRTADDWELLTVSPPRARANLSVASALSILMDAAAKRNGVVFALAFPNPAD